MGDGGQAARCGDSYEVIVRCRDGTRRQIHTGRPTRVGERVGGGVVVDLVCEGCFAYPCACAADDAGDGPCDPE